MDTCNGSAESLQAYAEIEEECVREAESCLYTSTMLYIWLRYCRAIQAFFVVTPIVLAGIGSWSILVSLDELWARITTTFLTLVAGMLPAIHKALKLDDGLTLTADAAKRFKVLEAPFRQLPALHRGKPLSEFQSAFSILMDKLSEARSLGVTPPEWTFRLAQKKIKDGHYDPDTSAKSEGDSDTSTPS